MGTARTRPRPTARRQRPSSGFWNLIGDPAVLSAGAGVALALALAVSAGTFGRRALAVTTLAALLAIISARRAGNERLPGLVAGLGAGQVTRLLLGGTVLLSLVAHVVRSPAPEDVPPRPLGFVLAAAVALAVLVTFLPAVERFARARRLPIEKARIVAWLGCAAVMGVAVFRSVPAPFIDVWTFQQEASAALLGGQDPYTHVYTNVFGNLAFFSPAIADMRSVYAFPYPPLTILLDLPAYLLFGDTRYAMLGALLVGAWAIARLAPGRTGALAAGAVLFHPRTFYVLDRAWTEPTVLAAMGGVLLALSAARREGRSGWIALGVAAALLLAAKQYAVLFALPLVPLLPRGSRARAAALAVAVLAVVTLPFLLWDFPAFWRGVVAMQVVQPFRADSLSWPAALVQLGGAAPPSPWVGFVVAAVAIAFSWPQGRAVAGGVLCGVAGFLGFLLFGKQAFLNYYWLANALLFAVCALQAREPVGVAVGGTDDRREARMRGDACVQRG